MRTAVYTVKSLLLGVGFCLFAPLGGQAQGENFVSLSYGYAPDPELHIASVDAYRVWPVGLKGRLMAGGGVRYNYQGSTGQISLELIDDNRNANAEVLVSGLVVHNLALFAEASYRISDRLEGGFNIELVGVTFGPEQSLPLQPPDFPLSVEPETLGLLLVGENDLGTLNSEFFAAYRVSERLWLRANLSYVVNNYLTTTPVTSGEEARLQRFFSYLTVGVQFQL
ncbi:MAG: hypothetical protein SFY70_05515 [Bacteroidia bacterium]|nr:hypothetical protein [Bacteroidia bacterium]